MHKAVKVKPKMQWRVWNVGDARNVERPLRKAAGSKQGQSRRKVT
jgi:hypothetical protein